METEAPEVEVPDRSAPSDARENDPRFAAARAAGQGDKGREMLEHAAMGAELDADEERSALDWMLGDAPPAKYDVTVQYETPAGLRPVTFVLHALDTRKIDEIEQRHVNRQTGQLDVLARDCELVCEATEYLTDRSGRKLRLSSEEYRTVTTRNRDTGETERVVLADSGMALERRFRKQLGLLGGVANQIRLKSGYDPERVGAAQRRLVEASLG